MRICSIHIYGYGKYHDFSLELKPGLNVIEGGNEAGKSTLLSFVKAMFFGFESRRYPEMRYEPLEGGRFGGNIVLQDEQGHTYKVERIGKRTSQGEVKVIMPNGNEQGGEVLPSLLLGMTPSFYTSIFSFGLTELSYVTSLAQEEVSSYLYHGGTSISLPALKKEWNDEMEQRFKGRGTQPILNQLLTELEEIDQELTQLQRKNETYNEWREKKQSLDQMFVELQTKQYEFNTEHEKWKKCSEVYALCKEQSACIARLNELPTTIFPENGTDRLTELERELRVYIVERESAQQQSNVVKEECASLWIHPDFYAIYEKITILNKDGMRWIEKQEIQSSLQLQIEFMTRELNRDLQQLGTDWTEERLRPFDVSISQNELFREQRHRFQSLRSGIQSVQEMIQVKQVERTMSNEQLDQMRQKIKQLESEQELLEHEQNLSTCLDLLREIDWEQKKQADSQHVPQDKIPTGPSYLGWMPFLFLGLGSIGSIAIFLTSGFSWSVLVPLLLAGMLFVGVFIRSSDNSGTMHRNDQETTKRMEEKKRQVANLAAQFGYKPEVNWLQQRLDHVIDLRGYAIQHDEKHNWLMERHKQLEQEWLTLDARFNQLQEEQKEEEEQWQRKLTRFFLPLGLSPDGALDMLSIIKKAKENLDKLEQEQKKWAHLQSEWFGFKGQLNKIYVQLDLSLDEEDAFIRLQRLVEWAQEQERKNKQKQTLQRQVKEWSHSIDEKKILIEKLREERDTLLATVSAEDSETFRRMHRLCIERDQLQKHIRTLSSTLEGIGVDEQIFHRVDMHSLDEITRQVDQWDHQAKQTNLEMTELVDLRGQYTHRLEQLEAGDTLSHLIQRRQECLTAAETEAKKWVIYRMANHLLDKTKEAYEARKQPGVLKEASVFFGRMTQNKYHRIWAPIGEERLIIERHDGLRLDPKFLSRGTREQLFLSLRFGLIKESSQTGTLPIMLDDIFVNFDEQRKRIALQTIHELAITHQILYFTCQPRIKKLIDELDVKDYHPIQLET